MPVKDSTLSVLPLQTQVYQAILEGIISLRLAPGTRLVENRLALQLGVSRLPVREALRQLEREQLVVVNPRRGASVASLTARDADEVYTLRITLEPLAARLAAENAGGEAIRAMERTLADQAAQRDPSQREAHYRSGARFHTQIVAASGNRKLEVMLGVISYHVARLRTVQARSAAPALLSSAIQGHSAIWQAISRRQSDLAGELMEEHVRLARDRIVSLLESTPVEEFAPAELPDWENDVKKDRSPGNAHPTSDRLVLG